MSSTRAAIRRNESKSSAPASNSGRSGSIPSIRGVNTFNQQQQQLAIRNNNQNQMQQQQQRAPPQHIQLTQQQQRLTQQQLNQQQRSSQPQQNHQQQTKSQMTIDQAITLITLRLGRLEVFMNEIENNGLPKDEQDGDRGGGMDEDLAQNILTRLDTLEEGGCETNPQLENNTYADKTEVSMLKQQVDALKKLVTSSTKTINVTNTASTRLKSEMEELRKSLLTVEQIAIENNTQIMLISINKEADDEDEQSDAEQGDAEQGDTEQGDAEQGDADDDATAYDATALDNTVFVEDEPDNQDIDE